MAGFDNALGISTQVLALRSQRMNLLSANIANAETPNYKARDIDFRAALTQASSSQEGAQLRGAVAAEEVGAVGLLVEVVDGERGAHPRCELLHRRRLPCARLSHEQEGLAHPHRRCHPCCRASESSSTPRLSLLLSAKQIAAPSRL